MKAAVLLRVPMLCHKYHEKIKYLITNEEKNKVLDELYLKYRAGLEEQ